MISGFCVTKDSSLAVQLIDYFVDRLLIIVVAYLVIAQHLLDG